MPYGNDLVIDFSVLESEIDYVYSCGAHGIVLALASEVLRLDESERFQVSEFMVEKNRGRGTVTVSVGAESTRSAVRFAKQAADAGADALMAIPPLSTPAGEAELRSYFTSILNAVKLPVVVQDASAYIGRPLAVAFQVELWKEHGDRIAFKPESAPVGPVITAINRETNGKARIFEGSGGSQLVENFRRSITGTMPGVDLLDAIMALWHALIAEQEDRVYSIAPLVGSILSLAVGLDGYLAIEKHLMMRRGIFKNALVRGPVGFELDHGLKKELDRLFDRLQIVLSA